jgi:hypothetical protein
MLVQGSITLHLIKIIFLAFDDPHVLVSCRVHLEHEHIGKFNDAQSFRQYALESSHFCWQEK